MSVRVLFVDDDAALLRAFARTYADDVIDVLCASSPADALEVLRHEAIDVVVSDLDMPELDGIELLATIRREHPTVLRMMLTAAPSLERALRAINDGEVHRFFCKPLDEAEFRRALLAFAERILRLRREGEWSQRDVRRAEFFSWVDRTSALEPAPSRNERGEIVVDLERLEGALQAAGDATALSVIGAFAL